MTFCILITPFHLEVPFSYILLSLLHLGPLISTYLGSHYDTCPLNLFLKVVEGFA